MIKAMMPAEAKIVLVSTPQMLKKMKIKAKVERYSIDEVTSRTMVIAFLLAWVKETCKIQVRIRTPE